MILRRASDNLGSFPLCVDCCRRADFRFSIVFNVRNLRMLRDHLPVRDFLPRVAAAFFSRRDWRNEAEKAREPKRTRDLEMAKSRSLREGLEFGIREVPPPNAPPRFSLPPPCEHRIHRRRTDRLQRRRSASIAVEDSDPLESRLKSGLDPRRNIEKRCRTVDCSSFKRCSYAVRHLS